MEIRNDFFSYTNEKPRKPNEIMSQMVAEAASSINAEAESRFGAKSLLLPDGTVRVENFDRDDGGIYDAESIEKHKKEVFDIEYSFTGAEDQNIAEFYATEHKCSTPEEVVSHWKKTKEKSKSGMLEQAMLVLLHKFLKEDFLVVRTAAYDDYKAGVDNLIIDKETGDVICAFDEVHDNKSGADTKKKFDKIKKISERGGANVHYGLTVEASRIKQTDISNVPVFALSLESAEFAMLLPVLMRNGLDKKDSQEKEVMSKLIISLGEQAIMLRSARINGLVRANLNKFGMLLEKMKKLVEDG
jgi:hypothetical protein